MNTLLVMVFPTLLATASRDAGDELLLEDHVDDDYRHDGQRGGREQSAVISAVLAVKGLQSDGEQLLFLISDHKERPQVVFPVPQERDIANAAMVLWLIGRMMLWKILVSEAPSSLAASISSSEMPGDGLAEQEDAERAYHAGQHEGRVGVLQTPVGEHLVLRVMVTAHGIIMVLMTTPKSRLRPRKRILENT